MAAASNPAGKGWVELPQSADGDRVESKTMFRGCGCVEMVQVVAEAPLIDWSFVVIWLNVYQRIMSSIIPEIAGLNVAVPKKC